MYQEGNYGTANRYDDSYWGGPGHGNAEVRQTWPLCPVFIYAPHLDDSPVDSFDLFFAEEAL